jgi:hypothetical protein
MSERIEATGTVEGIQSIRERRQEKRRRTAGRKLFQMAANLQANGVPLNLENFGWNEKDGFQGYQYMNASSAVEAIRSGLEAGLIHQEEEANLIRQVQLISSH